MQLVDAFDQLANIAQICQKTPTITLRRAYVRAMREWAQQSHWLRESVAGATVAGQRLYSLGSDPYLDIVGVQAVQASQNPPTGIQYWSVCASDPTMWDPNLSTNQIVRQPVRYAYIPEGQIAFDPIPNDVYNVLITIIVQPKEGATMIPAAPLVKYSNEIEAGALAYLFNIPGQKWTSPQMAAMYAKQFQSGISNAKAEEQRAYNVGSMRARPRNFVK